jgi:AcrR family transcriptional regulator
MLNEGVRRMTTSRYDKKMETRGRVLEAARDLFTAPGFNDTTVRMIALKASVAVGTVFTTFDTKDDILFEIVAERYDALAEALAEEITAAGTASAREKMKRCFARAYAFEWDRRDLLLQQISCSWTWGPEFEQKSLARLQKPFGFVGRLLTEAAANGEIAADAEILAIADLLLGIYMRNWRHSRYRNYALADVCDLAGRQIDLVFKGAA